MAKLPSIPQAWKNPSGDARQGVSRPDLTRPQGILDGRLSPVWSLENSGLGFLLHPETVAQIDFGDRGASPPVSMVARLAQERGDFVPPRHDPAMDARDQMAQAGGPLPYYMRSMRPPAPEQLPVIDRARMETDGNFDSHAEAPGAIRQMVKDTAAGVYQGRIVEDFNRDLGGRNAPVPIPKDRTYWIGPGGISPIGRTPSYETRSGRTYVDRNGDSKPDLEIEIDPKTRGQLVNYGDGAGFVPYDPRRVIQPPYIEPPHLSRKIPLR